MSEFSVGPVNGVVYRNADELDGEEIVAALNFRDAEIERLRAENARIRRVEDVERPCTFCRAGHRRHSVAHDNFGHHTIVVRCQDPSPWRIPG